MVCISSAKILHVPTPFFYGTRQFLTHPASRWLFGHVALQSAVLLFGKRATTKLDFMLFTFAWLVGNATSGSKQNCEINEAIWARVQLYWMSQMLFSYNNHMNKRFKSSKLVSSYIFLFSTDKCQSTLVLPLCFRKDLRPHYSNENACTL